MEYRVTFTSPPGRSGGQTFFEAPDDAAALAYMKATWSYEEVVALHALPGGRGTGSQIRVWVKL